MVYSEKAAEKTQEFAEDTSAQIARLREQVEALMKDRVTPALSDLAGRAGGYYNAASGTVRGQAAAMSGQVKENPLTAVLIAAGIGWIIGRLTR